MMNIFNRIRASGTFVKISSYVRIGGRIATPIGWLMVADAIVVGIWTEMRWRRGFSRVYDPPIWTEHDEGQIQNIIDSRQPIVTAIKNLYEMKEGESKDEDVAKLFSENCILEEPRGRYLGRREIMKMYSILPKVIAEMHLTEYKPTHYEDKILIQNVRSYKLRTEDEVPDILKSNIVIFLERGDDETTEKAKYVAEEWNYVSLAQPETHDMYLFAGTTAKYIRRFLTMVIFASKEDDKKWYNIHRLFDACKSAVKNLKNALEEERERQMSKLTRTRTLREPQENVFDAGKEKDPIE